MYSGNVIKLLGNIGLIPLMVIDSEDEAVNVAQALINGGINTAEIAYRTECASGALKHVKRQFPNFLAGAGTILTVSQAEDAVSSGADYIVTPGYDSAIVDWCLSRQVPVIPGCVTASEISRALSKGIEVVKFFPAESCGGVKTCANLAAPFGSVKFFPTGGINLNNLSEYAKHDFIHAVGGSWLCSRLDVKEKNWAGITETAKKSIAKLLDFQVVHVGINTKSADDAKNVADSIANIFGFPCDVNTASTFVGTGFEINHSIGPGKSGHIAIDTNNVERAEYYLSQAGACFDEKSRIKAGDKTAVIYIDKDFGGFAIHLRQRKSV